MSILVIVFMVLAYIVAVALLLSYIVVFIAPHFRSGKTNPALDLGRRAEAYLLKQELRQTLPRRNPVDPVCGRDAPLDGLHSRAWNGHVYYFCSEACGGHFAEQPQAYLSEAGAPLVRPQRSSAHFR